MPDRTRHRIKMKICGGGCASQVDQGRHSRFTARVLLRPGILYAELSLFAYLGPVYMEAGLARLARQPGKRDEFLLCLYEKISSRLPGQFSCFDIDLTVVKNSLPR